MEANLEDLVSSSQVQASGGRELEEFRRNCVESKSLPLRKVESVEKVNFKEEEGGGGGSSKTTRVSVPAGRPGPTAARGRRARPRGHQVRRGGRDPAGLRRQ